MSESVFRESRKFNLASLTNNLELMYGVVLAAQIPSALGYLKRVWSSGHYQFAILFVPIVVMMMKGRLDQLQNTQRGSPTGVILLMCITAMFMVLSTFVAPMFWILSFMFLTMSYVYDKYGTQGVKAILPLWLILAIVIPLPRGLDNLLVTKMQIIASEMASWILDALGLVHFRNGVVLVTETDQFMTEEACSGIRSLFSSLAAIGLYCVYKKYPVWRFLFNLAQTVFWVLVGNAIRIATVVWVAENWTRELAEGTPHELLGLAIFLLIILLVISTDRILQVLIDMWRWNRDDDEFEDPVVDAATVDAAVVDQGKAAGRWFMPGFILLALFLAFCDIRLMTTPAEGILRNPLFAMPPFPMSAEEDLPRQIGNWELVKYEQFNRGEERILAAYSYTWQYKRGDIEVLVSVDGPWEFWHDITACYRGIGWTADTTHQFDLQPADDPGSSGPLNHSRIELTKVTGEEALVFFAQHDMRGKVVRPSMLGGMVSLELMKLNFLHNLRTIVGVKSFDAGYRQYRLPLATIQVLCNDVSGLTDQQLAEIEQFYFEVRRLLIKSPRFEGDDASRSEALRRSLALRDRRCEPESSAPVPRG